MTTEDGGGGLVARLARARRKVGYIQKDAANTQQNYRYVSAAAVLEKINNALAEEGIATTAKVDLISSGQTPSGKQTLVTVKVTIFYWYGTESLQTEGLGSGADSGDKAVMKAQTAASKYCHMMAFAISTGDDPEEDADTDRREREPRAPARSAPQQREAPPQSLPLVGRPQDLPNGDYLEGFARYLDGIELPGECVNLWIKHRAALQKENKATQQKAWDMLCACTNKVGKMANAKVWLKRAIAEEDARKGSPANNSFA